MIILLYNNKKMEYNLNQNSEYNDKEWKNDLKEENINKAKLKELNNNENNKNEKEIDNNMDTGNTIDQNIEEPIYVMTLALEQGKSEKIEIFVNSDPAKLAYDFCSKNNLDYNALDYLKEQITNLLESYAKNENEDYYNENRNEDINIPEIEEVKEEFNITENYKMEEINIEDYKNKNQNKTSNNIKYRNKILDKENEDIMNKNRINFEIKDEVNIEENNNNAEYYPENIDKKIKSEVNEKLYEKKLQEVNSNLINNSKKRNYKINEDIIIGIGDNNNDSNKSYKLKDSEKKKNEIEKINYYNNITKENKKNSEQILTNYLNQDTKTNTHNNIIQNEEEEEKNNIYVPKNDSYIYHNIKNFERKNNIVKINKNKSKENIFNIDKINFRENNKNRSIGKIKKIKEEYDKRYSFKPVINDNYKTDLSFNERLILFNNITKIKREELKKNLSDLKDEESGQYFFKPKLISKQLSSMKNKKEDNNKNMDIFNKNYLYWEKYNLNKQNLYNKLYQNKGHPQFYSKIESDKIINESYRKAFINLFNILDSDEDNLITSVSINLHNIPEKIIKIIEPLLIELKEDNQTLNQDEFIKAMNKLFENISFTKRRELINEYNKYNCRSKTPMYNYRAKIKKKISNKNTNKLAEKHHLKMQTMMNVYKNKYNNKTSYDKASNSNNNNFYNYNKNSQKLSYINDCTFNNYLKNLN